MSAEADTPTAAPKLPNPWVPRGLWIAGAIVVIVAIPVAYKSMPAFIALFVVGVALIVAGAIVWGVQRSQTKKALHEREAQRHQTRAPGGCASKMDDMPVPLVAPSTPSTPSTPATSLAALPLPMPLPMPMPMPLPNQSSSPPPVTTTSAGAAPVQAVHGFRQQPQQQPQPSQPSQSSLQHQYHNNTLPPALDLSGPTPPPLSRPGTPSGETTQTPPRTPRRDKDSKRRVAWMDDNQPSGSPLARVKDFHYDDPVIVLHSEREILAPDHPPKQVPALLPAQRVALGYQSAAAPPVEPLPPNNFHQASSYYTPPQNRYPTVDEIAQERQRFQARPQTPEMERARRLGGVLEASAMLKPDYMSVPVLPTPMVM